MAQRIRPGLNANQIIFKKINVYMTGIHAQAPPLAQGIKCDGVSDVVLILDDDTTDYQCGHIYLNETPGNCPI